MVCFGCTRVANDWKNDCTYTPYLWYRFHPEGPAGLRAEHYFDVETGYGKWIPRWGGNDGPDDAAENGLNWTVLYTLGAPPVVLDLWKRGYEGHIKQYTEAKTVEVPMARDGMYYRDFSVMFDFFHHTESLSAFTLSGLADPFDDQYAERTKRFAAMYMGEDPEAPNYDKELKLIRSIFTGSRGPMLRKATGLDWAGDPLTYADGTPTDIEEMVREGRGGLALLHGEHSYQQMIEHFEECVSCYGCCQFRQCVVLRHRVHGHHGVSDGEQHRRPYGRATSIAECNLCDVRCLLAGTMTLQETLHSTFARHPKLSTRSA